MVCSLYSIGSTYTGPIDFLDNQSNFENMFGLAQDMLLFTARFFRVIETLFDQKFQLYVVALNYIFFVIYKYNTLRQKLTTLIR